MKIKVQDSSIEQVLALPQEKPITPKRPSWFFRTLMKLASAKELKQTNFTYTQKGMEKLGKQPCLILMNHSSFIDLKIAQTVLYPRPFNIVMTADGFVGKKWLMRNLGCIPTEKFVTDASVVRNIMRCLQKLRTSVLLFPEASYSFDGTATPLPAGVGKLIKHLAVPVVMISTHGAFLHDPLYNGLQLRQVDVSAQVEYLLSPQQIEQMTWQQINDVLKAQFTFDAFAEQQQKGIVVSEPFRADGLNRVLYKCPVCLAEGHMEGKGTTLTCKKCGAQCTLDEHGCLRGENIPFRLPSAWYNWQRQCVRQQLQQGTYQLQLEVDILVKKGNKAMYRVGSGLLRHDKDGFWLEGCDGKLQYHQPPGVSYSLYSDFFWYEIGDVICIGTQLMYYCFPKGAGDVVAKARLATEELHKLAQHTQK